MSTSMSAGATPPDRVSGEAGDQPGDRPAGGAAGGAAERVERVVGELAGRAERVVGEVAGRAEHVMGEAMDRLAEGPVGEFMRRHLTGAPDVGAGVAAKAVAQDAKALVQAEVALAKAEVTASVKAKATGAGVLVGAAVAGWLGLQGLLITLGFLLALVVPGWAAALIVTLLLLAAAGAAALVARRMLATPLKLDTTKRNVEEDLSWARAHLPGR